MVSSNRDYQQIKLLGLTLGLLRSFIFLNFVLIHIRFSNFGSSFISEFYIHLDSMKAITSSCCILV